MRLPRGFQAAGGVAGIKRSGKPDLALVCADTPLRWAFVATENRVKAPCVVRNRARYVSLEPIRAVVVNSGNANCATGEAGIADNDTLARVTAATLGLAPHDVLTASTGVIGHKLPVERIQKALPQLAQDLDGDVAGAAEAIMTTDTNTKIASVTLDTGAIITGVAKGAGMIHPNMATMMAFVMTDADLPQEVLRALWPQVVDVSFNQITVDGDTSTNDMALLLSSAHTPTEPGVFREGLEQVAITLAKKVARDGEGATKLITATVTGARNDREARQAARAVVKSPLVKSAAHGNDPNWGRILAAVGYSGAAFDPAQVVIRVQGVEVYRGAPQPFDAATVSASMDTEVLGLEVDLGVNGVGDSMGNGVGVAWGCDLTAEYVRINADYHT